ncbi:MAG: DUF5666 domain-containing protein [Parvularcula sp.]|jgi:hypothetical protein|nr:DUF5666 domain-containing protein [Parvularcula sp.]
MSKSCLAAMAAVSSLALATASAQNPYLNDEGDNLTLSGTVNSVDDDSFTIDYGTDVIEVEFEEAGLFDDPAESLYPGDQVTVYGTIDDDFFEGRVVEAQSVYVRGDSTVYGGDQATSALFFIDPYPTTMAQGSFVSLDGEVTRVRDREFMLDAGGVSISVDTMELGYNPLDEEGRQQIQEGDRVTVAGYLDDALFDDTELSARAIYKTDSGMSNRSSRSTMSRNDREDNRSNRSNSNRYSSNSSDSDRSNRDRNRSNSDRYSSNDDRDRSDRSYSDDDRSERSNSDRYSSNRQDDRMRSQDRDERRTSDRSNRNSSSESDMERMFITSEFAALDRNGDGVVTENEYVRKTSMMANITRSEARELFAAISGEDDELTRREFLNPNPDTEDLFERVLLREDS